MPNRTADPARSGRWPLTQRWTVVVVGLALLFVLLRVIHSVAQTPDDTAIFTEQVVVVGVTGRQQLNDTDRAVLGANLDNAQAGAVSVRPRYIGDCAAAGWTTLGAGRRAAVGGLCDPQVEGRQVVAWPARLAAASAGRGDAQLGTLAASVPGCVAAVGPGAALAAAHPDGSLARYTAAAEFLAGGAKPSCPITLVDGGPTADAIITRLAAQPDVTLYVTGIGPAPGSHDPNLQVIYRIGTTLPGWLTSASTRRQGVVTLADLTRTLIDFGQGHSASNASAVDGTPLQVYDADLTVPAIEAHLAATAAISSAAVTGYLAVGIAGFLLLVAAVVGLVRGRYAVPKIFTLGCVLPAAMLLTGAVPWYATGQPHLVVALLGIGWAAALTAAALLLSRPLGAPAAAVGAGLTVLVFTVDAALGGLMQPGSLLNSRPVNGGRWYGFGNVTFSVYATAGLVLAGYLAHRFLVVGRRVAALVSVAVIGFGVVICEGWPSMGTDFGGVISLTPGVLWLLLVLSGVRITLGKLLVVGGGAVLAIAAISYLDWRRGPELRSHLGNFVQRVIDGDAFDIISRKGVAALDTVRGPVGLIAVVLGTVLWVLIFRRLIAVLTDDFATLRPVAVSVLLTAILGTVLNDGGAYVWLTVTLSFSLTVGALWVDRARADGHLDWVGRPSR